MAGTPKPRREPTQGIRCTGTTQSGEPCGKFAVTGLTRCQYHRADRNNCARVNADGSPCTRVPMEGSDVCYSHTPELVAAENATAKRCTGFHQDGTPCRFRPLKGMEVCKGHGGGTPASRRAAARRIEEEKARKALDRLGEPVPVTNALLTLQKRAARIEAFADFLEQQLFQIQVTDWTYKSQQELEQVHGLAQMYGAQQDKCVSALTGLARVQVDDRLVAIEEKKAEMIMAAHEAAIAAYNKALGIAVNTEAQRAAYQAFSRKLTVVRGEIEPA